MASLGSFLLLAAFVVCSYAAAISIVGARRRSRRLIESGVGAFYLVCALMTSASAVLINAFLTDDFSIKYVAHSSDLVQPLFYKFTSYWGALDGSIMFWVFLLSVFGSLAVYVNRERYRELIPYVVATISIVEMFFLYLMVAHKNPFTTYLSAVPADGQGLNPLLQNYWMAIHPPSLYTGFVGMTIPYAFCMAALITGHLDDSWLRAVRRWTMFAWLFLTFGLMLGMIWAYEVLGWGGYWAWDPVENAALLPWFTATAFIHSVMVQERRSMLRVWNVTLVITTFFLTIFGTFMTRSGVVSSIHAFGDDPILAKLFTGFMILVVTVSFGFVIYRLPMLKARNELDSWLSREGAFLANNWIMLFSAFFVLFATMFPTLSEAVTGDRLTVGEPFFNKWMVPIGLIMLFLTGVGPLLAWRKTTLGNVKDQFLWPTVSGLTAAGVVTALGIRFWAAGLCFTLCAFVTGTIAQEFLRGGNVRRKNTGTDLLTAIIGLVGRNKRRYGGYIVHLGAVLIFLGFAGNGSKKDSTVQLKLGETATVGAYMVRNDRVTVVDDGQKQIVTGYIAVFKDGKQIDTMYPGRSIFHKHEDEQPRAEVAIRRTIAEDLYLVLPVNPEVGSQTISLEIVVNPLVNWVWLGFGILAFGTGIALLPERALSFAVARLPAADAVAGTAVLLLMLMLGGTSVSAQMMHVPNPTLVIAPAKNALEDQLREEIGCTCGTCAHESLHRCTCSEAEGLRQELRAQIDRGKSHDQIVDALAVIHGGHQFLRAPQDKGFNRLAWLLPYALAATGIVAIGFAAVKWTRKPDTGPETPPSTDAAIEERIDDELRDLD